MLRRPITKESFEAARQHALAEIETSNTTQKLLDYERCSHSRTILLAYVCDAGSRVFPGKYGQNAGKATQHAKIRVLAAVSQAGIVSVSGYDTQSCIEGFFTVDFLNALRARMALAFPDGLPGATQNLLIEQWADSRTAAAPFYDALRAAADAAPAEPVSWLAELRKRHEAKQNELFTATLNKHTIRITDNATGVERLRERLPFSSAEMREYVAAAELAVALARGKFDTQIQPDTDYAKRCVADYQFAQAKLRVLG